MYKFLKQQGGAEQRLGEEVVVPLVLEPFMQALQYIHEKVGKAMLHTFARPGKGMQYITTAAAVPGLSLPALGLLQSAATATS